MWFFPGPVSWSSLWRACRADLGQGRPSSRRRGGDDHAELLALGSIGRMASLDDVLYLPSITQLLVDDVCLQSALCLHAARRPHRWQRRATANWRREGALLEVERDRLAREAARLGSRLSTPVVEHRRGPESWTWQSWI